MPISKCFDPAVLRPSIPSVVACILSLTVSAHSQTYQSPKFIGEDLDRVSLRHIVALDDGALIVSGYGEKSNKAESIILKLGKDGDIIWQTGIGNGAWSSIASRGNEIVAATLEERALTVRRLNDATGAVVWERNHDLSGEWTKTKHNYARVRGMTITSVGDITVLVDIQHDFLYHAFRVISFDAKGQLLWEITHGAIVANNDNESKAPVAIAARADGGVIVVGETDGTRRASDGWIMAFDRTGKTLWQKVWGNELSILNLFVPGQPDIRIKNIAAAPDGGAIVYAVSARAPTLSGRQIANCTLSGSGDCRRPSSGDLWLLRLDAAGRVRWDRKYEKVEIISEDAIVALPVGNFALAASHFKSGEPRVSRLMHMGSEGSLLGEKRYGSPHGNSSINGLASLRDGSLGVLSWTRKNDKEVHMIYRIPSTELGTGKAK
jgi:hypothetical protein